MAQTIEVLTPWFAVRLQVFLFHFNFDVVPRYCNWDTSSRGQTQKTICYLSSSAKKLHFNTGGDLGYWKRLLLLLIIKKWITFRASETSLVQKFTGVVRLNRLGWYVFNERTAPQTVFSKSFADVLLSNDHSVAPKVYCKALRTRKRLKKLSLKESTVQLGSSLSRQPFRYHPNLVSCRPATRRTKMKIQRTFSQIRRSTYR